jgi:Phage-related lysozyme (muraminidase)
MALKNLTKKAISLILAGCMLIGCMILSSNALAADTEEFDWFEAEDAINEYDESSFQDEETEIGDEEGFYEWSEIEQDGEMPDGEESEQDFFSTDLGIANMSAVGNIRLRIGTHEKYMNGYGSGLFGPNNAITRQEVAHLLYKLLENVPKNKTQLFYDVGTNQWYSTAVNSLAKAGILKGNGKGYFKPQDEITRAEFVTILARLFESKTGTMKYTDVPKSHWAYKSIITANQYGWINGYGNGIFKPNNSITRAEAVTILNRVLERKDSDFAKDRNDTSKYFKDVPKGYWAFLDIIEAAAPPQIGPIPTVAPTKSPTPTPVTLRVIGEDVNFRTKPSMSSGSVIQKFSEGTLLNQIDERTYYPWTKAEHTKSGVGYIHSDYVEVVKPTSTPIKSPTPTPTKAPTPTPMPSTQVRYIKTIVGGVNFRNEPSTASSNSILATLSSGTSLKVLDDSNYKPWIRANSVTYGNGYIHSDYVAYINESTPEDNTVSGNGKISTANATVALYKTMYVSGSISNSTKNMTWTSDDSGIALVFTKSADIGKAFIYGKKAGTTTIRLKDLNGKVQASCKVTVSSAEPVRFAYTDPSTPLSGSAFNLVAVTDNSRTGAKFVVSGAGSGNYETTTYTTETKSASKSVSGIPENKVRIFKKSVTFKTAGVYNVKVYSSTSSGWSSTYKEFSFRISGDTSYTTTSNQARSASNKIIDIIASFEGMGAEPGEIYIDTLSSGKVPTVGYGYVATLNSTFYNNLTQTEMKAMLSDEINNGVYVKNLESFRSKYNVKMSQVQFDALVSFGYNLGTGYFVDNSNYTFMIFLNAMQTPPLSAAGTVYVTNASYYSSAALGTVQGTIPKGTSVSVSEVKRVNGNVDNLWYKVKYNNKNVWIRGGYVRFNTLTSRDTEYIDEQLFGSNLMQWNKAGGVALPGLVYRRLAEAKVFCYGNYTDANINSSNYRKNIGFDVPSGVPGLALK